MDRDEVLAAIGRPERKVREPQADGSETEDWIYGRPRQFSCGSLGKKLRKSTRIPIRLSISDTKIPRLRLTYS